MGARTLPFAWLLIALCIGGCTLPDLSKHAGDQPGDGGGSDGGAAGNSGDGGRDSGPGATNDDGGGTRPRDGGQPDHGDGGAGGCMSAACAACKPGYAWDQAKLACADIDECAAVPAPCDALAGCVNSSGSFTCGACPDGYAADSKGRCAPLLTSLKVSAGELAPALDAKVTQYTLQVPLVTQTVSLTAKAPKNASIFVNGVKVTSGKAVASPPLAIGDTLIDIVVSETDQPSRHYALTVTRGFPEIYIKASNTGEGDNFGYATALSGDTLVISAPGEDGATGDAKDTADGATDSGAVYVFVRSGSTWKQQAFLKALVADQATPSELFGVAVAIDGDTLVVGASNPSGAGAGYVFVRSAGKWTQQARLAATNGSAGDLFGNTVALSGDTVVIGALAEDSNAIGIATSDAAGANDTVTDSGAAYVFTRAGTDWTLQAYIKAANAEANDQFGTSVAIDDDTLLIGAPVEDGSAVGAHAADGADANNDAVDSGAAYVFTRSGTTWTQQTYLKASNTDAGDSFGFSVAISGDTLIVGAKDEDSSARTVNGSQSSNDAAGSGAAYVFTRNGTSWDQQAYLKGSFDGLYTFGLKVAIDGDRAIVGGSYEESGQGAAYIFTRDAGNGAWSELQRVQGVVSDQDDFSGFSVAVSGDTFVDGAMREDSNATGIGGNASNNKATDSGAVYVFR